MMKDADLKLLREIRLHLFRLHDNWAKDPNNDGHHKSNEGYVGYSVGYPNWFEAENYLNDKPEVFSVEVYSYLFGPHRLHQFRTLQEAWQEVKTWEYEALS